MVSLQVMNFFKPKGGLDLVYDYTQGHAEILIRGLLQNDFLNFSVALSLSMRPEVIEQSLGIDPPFKARV
ncbi:hypothetical protein FOMPIDRAFT_1047622 [Fomitopsis schrenkii]|uniref:Uncharacterized protein n=1 Tax=Fomitopsis schrenkii TaxID=2126942 RepID=S8ED31_FOMSC|nr:hypothetical protein FOMPIDRAFT_1047622 [Fomitopsis schrenkii]